MRMVKFLHAFTSKICKSLKYRFIDGEKYENEDLNILNFEHIKCGYARHRELLNTLIWPRAVSTYNQGDYYFKR